MILPNSLSYSHLLPRPCAWVITTRKCVGNCSSKTRWITTPKHKKNIFVFYHHLPYFHIFPLYKNKHLNTMIDKQHSKPLAPRSLVCLFCIWVCPKMRNLTVTALTSVYHIHPYTVYPFLGQSRKLCSFWSFFPFFHPFTMLYHPFTGDLRILTETQTLKCWLLPGSAPWSWSMAP